VGSFWHLTPVGRRQPAGAEPRRLGFGKNDALHTAIYDPVSVFPAGITHPDRRLVRLVIVDEIVSGQKFICGIRSMATVTIRLPVDDKASQSNQVRILTPHIDEVWRDA